MNNRGILKKIKELEKAAPDKLIILVDDNGTKRETTVNELIKNPNLSFIKVLKGNSIKDIDSILSYLEPKFELTEKEDG